MSYAYDAQNQLVRENNNEAQVTYLYRHSANGNMLQKQYYDYTVSTVTPAAADLRQIDYYTYASGSGAWSDVIASTYTEHYTNGTLSNTTAANSITTDAIGNVTASAGWTYTWTMGNRLAAMENDDMRLTFAYNQDGKRVKKTVTDYTNNNAVTTYDYQWDNDMLIAMHLQSSTQDITELFYYDTNGNPVGVRQYHNASGTSYANYFYLHDAQNNVIGLCGTSGKVCGEYSYDSWGKETAAPVGEHIVRNINPIRYKDYIYDSETGLYCTGSRYYNPEWGRFLSIDNLETLNANAVGSILNDNLFIYCNDNPIMYKDSEGEVPQIIIAAIVVGAICVGFDYLGQKAEGNSDINILTLAISGFSGALTVFCGPYASVLVGAGSSIACEKISKGEINGVSAFIVGATSVIPAAGIGKIFNSLAGKKVNTISKIIKDNVNTITKKISATVIECRENSRKGLIQVWNSTKSWVSTQYDKARSFKDSVVCYAETFLVGAYEWALNIIATVTDVANNIINWFKGD